MRTYSNAITATSPVEPVQRYSRLTIAMHWLSAFLFLVVLGAIWSREWIDEFAVRVSLFNLHRQTGLVILMLLVVRLVARRVYPKKPSGPQHSPLVKIAVMLCHVALYSLILAMPMLGWLLTNAHGNHVMFLGAVQLPDLVSQNDELETILQFAHEYCAYMLVGLVTVHASAAIWHHVVRKDHVLAAMLPLVGDPAAPKEAKASVSPLAMPAAQN